MNTQECQLDQDCHRLAAAHADDYDIAGVAVHLGSAWTCPVHGIGEYDGLTVTWGTVEISLDAIAAVREDATAASRDLDDNDIAAITIRTPVHVAVHCHLPSDTGAVPRRRLATRLAGVVLQYAVNATDLDRTLELTFTDWSTDTEVTLINRAGWAAATLLSDRGHALPQLAVLAGMLDGLDYDATASMRVEISPEAVTIHLEICDLGDLSTTPWLRESAAVADQDDVDWLITATEDAIADFAS